METNARTKADTFELNLFKPFLIWGAKFIPTTLLGICIASLVTALDRKFSKTELEAINLGWPGEAAMWFFNHSIAWATFAFVFGLAGIVLLFVTQSGFPRVGPLWDKYILYKHIVFEHLAEILMLFCGALCAIAYRDFLVFGFVFFLVLPQLVAFLFSIFVSYLYFFALHNEVSLQQFISPRVKAFCDSAERLFGWIKNKIN